MTLDEKKRLFTANVLFSGLPSEAAEDAARAASEQEFPAGEVLFSAGGERRIGVIASGYARVVKPAKDGFVTMSILGPGDVFGAATLMGGALPSTEARAIKPVTAVLIQEGDFLALMDRYFGLTQNYCRYLIGRIRFLTERVECMAGGTASEKLWRYIEKNAENGTLHLRFGMDALANALSLSRASLYRAFDELERSGKLSRKGHEIRLI